MRSAAISCADRGSAHIVLDEPKHLPCTGGPSQACAGLDVCLARPARFAPRWWRHLQNRLLLNTEELEDATGNTTLAETRWV